MSYRKIPCYLWLEKRPPLVFGKLLASIIQYVSTDSLPKFIRKELVACGDRACGLFMIVVAGTRIPAPAMPVYKTVETEGRRKNHPYGLTLTGPGTCNASLIRSLPPGLCLSRAHRGAESKSFRRGGSRGQLSARFIPEGSPGPRTSPCALGRHEPDGSSQTGEAIVEPACAFVAGVAGNRSGREKANSRTPAAGMISRMGIRATIPWQAQQAGSSAGPEKRWPAEGKESSNQAGPGDAARPCQLST